MGNLISSQSSASDRRRARIDHESIIVFAEKSRNFGRCASCEKYFDIGEQKDCSETGDVCRKCSVLNETDRVLVDLAERCNRCQGKFSRLAFLEEPMIQKCDRCNNVFHHRDDMICTVADDILWYNHCGMNSVHFCDSCEQHVCYECAPQSHHIQFQGVPFANMWCNVCYDKYFQTSTAQLPRAILEADGPFGSTAIKPFSES